MMQEVTEDGGQEERQDAKPPEERVAEWDVGVTEVTERAERAEEKELEDAIALESQAQEHGRKDDVLDSPKVLVVEVPAPVTVHPNASLQVSKTHLVLLGDSTLDNERYLDLDLGDQPVGMQLARRCSDLDWEVTLLATDGSTLDDVAIRQVPIIPDDATHIVVSASGNDLLRLLNEVASHEFSWSSLYGALTQGLQEVSEKYRRIMEALSSHGCHVACCTVYQPHFKNTFLTALAACSLGLHNSRIRRIAQDLDFSVLDLAALCQDPDDFANPLELSTKGGRKVVQNSVLFAKEHPSHAPRAANERPWLAEVLGFNAECCIGCAPRRSYAHTVQEELIQDIPVQSPADFAQAQEPWRNS